MDQLWNNVFGGNTLRDWSIAAALLVLSFLALKLLRPWMIRRLQAWSQQTKNTLDDLLVVLLQRALFPLLYIGSVYAALSYLHLPARLEKAAGLVFLCLTTFYVLRMITAVIRHLVFSSLKGGGEAEGKQKQAAGLVLIIQAVIWLLGLVFLVDNLGYDVTTIVAGLGIGGIAIALAAQTVLGDLFSYFVIFFDRPFEIGDFIIVEEKMGTVEYIGIKTTRLRTLGGEQLVCSNTYLTGARVHNYKRMEQRRVLFQLGVVYQTSAEQLREIPRMVQKIIERQPDVRWDRGHFSGFGASSLDFEFVYYVIGADYNLYMDRQQAIYLDIFGAFERAGIEFAYPTQTLFVTGQEDRPAVVSRYEKAS